MNTTIKQILVPVDLQDDSISALNHAVALADRNGASIQLLHIVSYSSVGLMIPPEVHFSVPFGIEELVHDKMEILENWKARALQNKNVPIKIIVKKGNPAREVNKYAAENNIDFIVLGMHEHRSWLSRIFGSTAKFITRKSVIPVMTIFHKAEKVFRWRNVVLPVSVLLPEKRVKAILNFAMLHSIKIHFVEISKNIEKEQPKKFNLLLDSLRMVKAFGNIPVECKRLDGDNLLNAAWDYAININADAIMVNSAKGIPANTIHAVSAAGWS